MIGQACSPNAESAPLPGQTGTGAKPIEAR
jgi:hypothetical protein